MMLVNLSFVVGILTLLPFTHAGFYCGQTWCDKQGYDKAYCCGDNDEICCRSSETVVSIWWFWFIIVLVVISIGICVALLYLRRRRRLGGIPYLVHNNAPGVTVQTSQTHVAQVNSAPAYPNHGTGQPTAPAGGEIMGYPPAYPPQQAYQPAQY